MPLRPIFAEMFDTLKKNEFRWMRMTWHDVGHMLAMNSHPEAIRLLEEEWGKDQNLDWRALSENGSFAAINLIEREVDRRGWIISLNAEALSVEPLALPLLERNKGNIDWRALSANPAALHLIGRNPDTVNWLYLAQNPSLWASEIMEANLDKVAWTTLSANPSPHAIRLLEANVDKIDWTTLSTNPSPRAIRLLEANVDKIDWAYLSSNSEAASLLEKHQDKIDWSSLARNSSPFAARMLEENQDKIECTVWDDLNSNKNPDILNLINHVLLKALNYDNNSWHTVFTSPVNWRILSENPAAIHLLEANPNNICWFYHEYDYNDDVHNEYSVWCNPAIFEDELGPPVFK